MWTEIIPVSLTRQCPMFIVQPPSIEEYELRLIIWETRDVYLEDDDKVDIYIKVIFDPQGWAGNVLEKVTDTHYNNTDGKGIFNYRMIFPIVLPCEFPRLKFQIFDYSLITNEAIGENILSLSQTMTDLS